MTITLGCGVMGCGVSCGALSLGVIVYECCGGLCCGLFVAVYCDGMVRVEMGYCVGWERLLCV
jgi:hypothetical protein